VIVPLAFIVNGPFGVDVKVTCPGAVPITACAPFKVSFPITLGVFVPGNTLGLSVTAAITGAVTVTLLVTVLQFVGFETSQMVYVIG
jgi:hypothetical protein